jgi:hypothetical protein
VCQSINQTVNAHDEADDKGTKRTDPEGEDSLAQQTSCGDAINEKTTHPELVAVSNVRRKQSAFRRTERRTA